MSPTSTNPQQNRRRRVVLLWFIAWLIGVAWLTLRPGASEDALGILCFPCGARGSADAVLNVGLFVPGGALLAALGAGFGAVAAMGFGLSTLIEVVQTQLPGRFPTVADIVMNGSGAVVGLLLFRLVKAGRFTTGVVVAGAGVALTVTALLGRGAVPAGPLYGQHTPRLGSWGVYEGAVVRAAVGGVEVPPGRQDDDAPLRAAVRHSQPLEVEFRVGPPPARWSPVFAVFSEEQEEVIFVAARGDDLFVRMRSLAGQLHFNEPSFLVEGALAGLPEGEPTTVRVERGRTGFCVATPVREECRLDASPVEGWRLLYTDLRAPGPWPLFTGFYVALVVALLLVVGTPRSAAVATAGLVTLAAVLALLTSSAPPEPVGVAGGIVVGLLVGAGVRVLRRWLVRRHRDVDTGATPAARGPGRSAAPS